MDQEKIHATSQSSASTMTKLPPMSRSDVVSPIPTQLSPQDNVMGSSQHSDTTEFEKILLVKNAHAPITTCNPSSTISRQNRRKLQYFYIVYRKSIPFIKIGITSDVRKREQHYKTSFGSCNMIYKAIRINESEMKTLESNVIQHFQCLSFQNDEELQGNITALLLLIEVMS